MDTSSIWAVFHQKMHRYLEKRVACSADADDLLQEIFVKIHLKLPTLANEDSLPFWVWRLTRNTLLDHYKKRRIPVSGLSVAELEMPALIDSDFNQHFAECVEPFLELLPPDRREAIQLADFQRIAQKELAQIWGIGYSGAKSRVQPGRIARAFQPMLRHRDRLQGQYPRFSPARKPAKGHPRSAGKNRREPKKIRPRVRPSVRPASIQLTGGLTSGRIFFQLINFKKNGQQFQVRRRRLLRRHRRHWLLRWHRMQGLLLIEGRATTPIYPFNILKSFKFLDMKSKKMMLAGLLVAGLIASAMAYRSQVSDDGGGCCDKTCAPLCCPGK